MICNNFKNPKITLAAGNGPRPDSDANHSTTAGSNVFPADSDVFKNHLGSSSFLVGDDNKNGNTACVTPKKINDICDIHDSSMLDSMLNFMNDSPPETVQKPSGELGSMRAFDFIPMYEFLTRGQTGPAESFDPHKVDALQQMVAALDPDVPSVTLVPLNDTDENDGHCVMLGSIPLFTCEAQSEYYVPDLPSVEESVQRELSDVHTYGASAPVFVPKYNHRDTYSIAPPAREDVEILDGNVFYEEDFDSSPSGLVGHIMGRRLDFVDIPSSDNAWSSQYLVQDSTGVPYVIDNSYYWRIQTYDNPTSRKFFSLLGWYYFSNLKKHEQPKAWADVLALYYQLVIRGSRSVVILSELTKYVDIPPTFENLGVRIACRTMALRGRANTMFEFHSAQLRWSLVLAGILSSLDVVLAADPFPDRRQNSWFSTLTQILVVCIVYYFSKLKTKHDPVLAAYNSAKHVFKDVETGFTQNAAFEPFSPFSFNTDTAYLDQLASRTAEFCAPSANPRSVSPSNSLTRLLDFIQSIPDIFRLLSPILSDPALVAVFEQAICATTSCLSLYLAHGVENGPQIQACVVISWLAMNCRNLVARGLEIPFFNVHQNAFENLPDLGSIFESYKTLKSSPLIRDFRKLLSKLVAGGMLAKYTSIDLSNNEFLTVFEEAMEGESIGEAVVSLIIRVIQVAQAVMNGVPIFEALSMFSYGDSEYVDLIRIMDNLHYENDLLMVKQKIDSMLAKTELLAKTSKSAQVRACSLARYHECLRWQKVWRTNIVVGKHKPQPFVVTFYGKAGIGKTTAIDVTVGLFHALHNKEIGPLVQSVGKQDPVDKFDSNLHSGTSCIVIDDLGVQAPEEAEEPPGVTINKYVGSNICAFTKSESHEKGVEVNLAPMVIITTNHRCANCDWKMTDPDAGVRRLGVLVEMKLKPEYLDAYGKPDSFKFPMPDGGLGRQCTYSFYRVINSEVRYTHKDLEAEEALLMLGEKYVTHQKAARNLVETTHVRCDVCCFPKVCCKCVSTQNAFCDFRIQADRDELAEKLQLLTKLYENKTLHWCATWAIPPTIRQEWLDGFGPFRGIVNATSSTVSTVSRVLMNTDAAVADLTRRFDSMESVLIASFGGIAAGVVAYGLVQLWNSRGILITPTDGLVQNLFVGDGGISLPERKAMLEEEKPWARVTTKPMIRSQIDSSINLEWLRKKCVANTFRVTFANRSGGCHGVFLKTGYLLLPGHAWYVDGTKLSKLECKLEACSKVPGEFFSKTTTLDALSTVFLPEKDAAVSYVANLLGDRYALHKHLPDDYVDKNNIVSPILGIDGSMINVSVLDCGMQYFTSAPAIKGFKYACPWNLGDCMLPVLYGDKNFARIAGFHIGVKQGSNIVTATVLTRQDYERVENSFAPNALTLSSTTKEEISVVPGFERVIEDSVHPNNVVNYIPEELVREIEVHGNLGKHTSPRMCTKYHPHKSVFDEVFHLPDFHPVKLSNRPLRNMVALSYENEICLDAGILKMALDDYNKKLSCVVDSIQQAKLEDTLYSVYKTDGGAYTFDEVVNGIPGHIHRTGMKLTASAGEPWRTKKLNVVTGEKPNCTLIPSVLTSISEMKARLKSGSHTGQIMRASLKDEPREFKKMHDPRVFQAPSVELYLMQSAEFGPLLDAAAAFPDLSGCAIGVSSHGMSWDVAIGRILRPGRSVLEYDVSKWDQTIPNAIRIGVGKSIVLATCKLRSDYSEQRYLERLYFDAITPLCSVNGALVECQSLWSSGIPMTAFGGAAMGYVLLAYSWYQHTRKDFNSFIESSALGDDVIASIPNGLSVEWNQYVIEKDFTAIGMQITSGHKGKIDCAFVANDEGVFLKRKTRYCHFKGHLVGQLEANSVLKTLVTIMKSKVVSEAEQTVDQMISVSLESLFHGEAAYSGVVARLRWACNRVGLPIPEMLAMDFRERIIYHYGDYLEIEKPPEYSGYKDIDDGGALISLFKEIPTVEEFTQNASGGITTMSTEPTRMTSIPETEQVPMYGEMDRGDAMSFDREYLLYEGTIPYQQIFVDQVSVFDVLTLPYLDARMKYVAGVHFDVKARIMISASAGNYGALLVSTMPMSGLIDFQNEMGQPNSVMLTVESSRNHVIVPIGSNEEECVLEVPVVIPNPTFYPAPGANTGISPSIRIRTLSMLNHVLGVTAPALIKIYVSLINLHTTCSTAATPNVAEVNEGVSGTLATGGMFLHDASKLMTGLPELGLATELVSSALTLGSNIARRFGYSKPIELASTASVVTCAPSLAVTDVDMLGRKLSLMHDQGVSITNLARQGDADELTFDYLLSKESIFQTWFWDTTMSSKQAIGSFLISPFMNTTAPNSPNVTLALTPSALIASQFQKWSGTMHYTVKFVSNSMFGGRVLFMYDPFYTSANLCDTSNTQSFIHDLKDGNEVHIEVGWGVNYHALQTTPRYPISMLYGPNEGYCNGVIYMLVLTPLSTMQGGTSRIDVIVSGRADKKMLFFDHYNQLALCQVHSVAELLNQPSFLPTGTGGIAPVWYDAPINLQQGPLPSSNQPPTAGPIVAATPRPHVTGIAPTLPPIPAPTHKPTYKPTRVPSSTRKPTLRPTTRPTESCVGSYQTCNVDTLFSPTADLVSTGTDVYWEMWQPSAKGLVCGQLNFYACSDGTQIVNIAFGSATVTIGTLIGSLQTGTFTPVTSGTNPLVTLPASSGTVLQTLYYTSTVPFRCTQLVCPQEPGILPQYVSVTDLASFHSSGSAPSLSTHTLVSGSMTALSVPVGCVITVPTVLDCKGHSSMAVFYSGALSLDGTTPNPAVVYPDAYGGTGTATSMTIGASASGAVCYGAIAVTNVHLRNVGTVPKWVVNSRNDTEKVARLCAGEFPASLRNLLKYMRPLSPAANNNSWVSAPLYEYNPGQADVLQMVLLGFVGVRGSMNYLYRPLPQPDQNLTTYVVRGSNNLDSVCDPVMSRGFEFVDTRQASSLVVNHPYYSGESFHALRSVIGPTLLAQNAVTRLWSTFSETGVMGSPTVVTAQAVSVGEDFSVVHFLGAPLLDITMPC
jgi:hypothetical protein